MRLVVLLLMAAGLAGCEGSIASDALKGPQVIAQEDDGKCRSMGAPPNSPNYYNCRMTLAQNREQHHSIMRRAMADVAVAQATQPPPPRPVTCLRGVGGSVTCY